MKKKFNNKKTISLTVAGLAALSVVTVGFSGWIIGAGESSDDAEVSIAVGDVTDNSLGLAIGEGNELALAFDADALATDTAGYIKYANEGDRTDMSFTANIIVSASSMAALNAKFKGLTIAFADSTILGPVITANAIATPVELGSSITILNSLSGNLSDAVTVNSTAVYNSDPTAYHWKAVVATNSATSLKVALTMNFSWGSALNYKDPQYLTKKAYEDNTNKCADAVSALDTANAAITEADSAVLAVTVSLVA